VEFLPVFTPNEFMFKQGKPGMEKWEVYAECVRDIMSEYSGFPKNEQRYQDMRDYWDLVGFRKSWDKTKIPDEKSKSQ
jgi:hypothetical protein